MNFKEFYLTEDLESKMAILVRMYKDLSSEEAKDRIELVNQADPSGSAGVYTQWLIKQDVSKKSIFPEDIDKLKGTLTVFDKIKKLNIPIKKDINQYKDFSELAREIEPYETETSKGEKERKEIKEGYETVFKDSTFEVLKITNPKASAELCYNFGAKNWCTKDEKYATHYLEKGPLYMFLADGEPYVQAHVETQSIMDFYDNPVSEAVFDGIYYILDKLGLIFLKYKLSDIMKLKGKTWRSNLDLKNSNITSLPDDFTIDGYLDLSYTTITELPNRLTVTGDLSLSDTSIKKIPLDLKVGGSIDLHATDITSLPDNIKKVNGYLIISNTKIKKLPLGMEIKKGLRLANTKIKELPSDLIVRGDLSIRGTDIEEIPETVIIQGDVMGVPDGFKHNKKYR